MDIKLPRFTLKEAGAAAAFLVAGWAAWDDVRDLSTANAQSIDNLAEAIEELDEESDLTDEQISAIQRVLIEQSGQTKVEMQQLRGDVKLILRLLEEKDR